MNLMSCRLISLIKTFQGYQRTGIPLIAFDGNKLSHVFTADDIGIYIIIPKIASFFNLPIEQAIHIFFYALLLIPALIGILGFLKLYKSTVERLVAIIAIMLLTRKAYGLGDVYLAYFSCISALVPWSLYFAHRKIYDRALLLYIFSFGMFTGFFHYIRAYSGIGVCLFTIVLLSTALTCTWQKKTYLMLALFLGFSLSIFYFKHAYHQSRIYAEKNLPNTTIGKAKHVFWHNLYIGFGFLKYGNQTNIEYNDSFGNNTVQSRVPEITLENNTSIYETILKQEVFNLFKNNTQFVLWTLFAKLGILILYLLTFANVGLGIAFIYRKPWYIEFSFFIGLLFYALFPLLTIPIPEYALGFISFATLYGLVSINYAIKTKVNSCYPN